MTLTIHLNDDLAARQKKQASSSQLPAKELAAKLLGEALAQLDRNETGGDVQNRRRLALIRKSIRAALSKAKQAELDALQASLDRQLESVDSQLLDTLDTLQHVFHRLQDNRSPGNETA